MSARQAEYDIRRGTPTARGYDGAWRRARAAYVAEHPYCEVIESGRPCGKPVYEVHHIEGVAAGHDDGNLVSLCRSHHAEVTARQAAGKGRGNR